MAGRKKAEKPEEDVAAAINAASGSSDDASNDGGDASTDPQSVGSEGSKTDTATPAVAQDAQASVTDGDKKATEKPEETTPPAGKPSTGLSNAQADAFLETVLGTTPRPNLRRFVVLKPVRFKGKRIPRAGRVTITRAGHDELAGLGAVSPAWDHGVPVKAE